MDDQSAPEIISAIVKSPSPMQAISRSESIRALSGRDGDQSEGRPSGPAEGLPGSRAGENALERAEGGGGGDPLHRSQQPRGVSSGHAHHPLHESL